MPAQQCHWGIPREGERGSLEPGDLSTPRPDSALRREGTRARSFRCRSRTPSRPLGCIGRGCRMRHARAGRAAELDPDGVKPWEQRMRVCVYCGSAVGNDAAFVHEARALGKLLAAEGMELVYGGGRVGLMGVLADAALAGGGRVIGVIPRALVQREIAHRGLTDLRVVETMHERKALMAELADGFLALPGGAGTLEELFEAWTWGQLGLHAKPCGLLNIRGYYDALLAFLDRATAEGFVAPRHRAMLVMESDARQLLDRFRQYAPPLAKWAGGRPVESEVDVIAWVCHDDPSNRRST